MCVAQLFGAFGASKNSSPLSLVPLSLLRCDATWQLLIFT
jgi:hypothetical protein